MGEKSRKQAARRNECRATADHSNVVDDDGCGRDDKEMGPVVVFLMGAVTRTETGVSDEAMCEAIRQV